MTGLREAFIARTEAAASPPLVHELRIQLALFCGAGETCEHEPREAERLWIETGARGHIERMAPEPAELGRQQAAATRSRGS